ncbi:MAG: hypothetical protein ACI9DK_003220 [Vicingaceae bacterium]|jgi:hypothetical protein
MEKVYKIYFISIILLFASCIQEKDKLTKKPVGHSYISYNLECCDEVKMDTSFYDYNVKVTDSLHYLLYSDINKSSRVKLALSLNESSSPSYLINDKIKEITYVSKRTLGIEFEKFQVYKFALNPYSIDGCITVFWVPEFGIILKRSSTWKDFRKLQSSNESDNKKINLLAELIYQNEAFYKGCTKESSLIPKDELKKYTNWKLSQLDSVLIVD